MNSLKRNKNEIGCCTIPADMYIDARKSIKVERPRWAGLR